MITCMPDLYQRNIAQGLAAFTGDTHPPEAACELNLMHAILVLLQCMIEHD